VGANDVSKEGLVKVTFTLEPGTWHGSATETLWAEPIGPGQYRLENSPFFAFGISYKDVVLARPDGSKILFVETFSRGGHSTYRIVPNPDRIAELDGMWALLQKYGCSSEEGLKGLLTVDVPPDANIFDVYRALEAGEREGVWTFEEGHCGHAVG
jgi:hypothetical protein